MAYNTTVATKCTPNPLIFDKLTNEGNAYFGLHKRNERGVTFSLNGTYGYAGKYVFNVVLNTEARIVRDVGRERYGYPRGM